MYDAADDGGLFCNGVTGVRTGGVLYTQGREKNA